MSSWWPRNGDVRGEGRNREVYYHGEWHSKKADDYVVKGDQVKYKQVTDPDYKRGMRIARRRGLA